MIKKLGFTLVEILITLTILSTLVGLAIVNYSGAFRQAEKAEAVASMDVIRQAQFLKRIETGSFLNAQDTAEINALLGTGVQEKLFKYKIVDATGADFMIIAERISQSLSGTVLPFAVTMNASGSIMDVLPTSGGAFLGDSGSGPASGSGSGSSGGGSTTSGGGSSGGSSGGGGGGGSSSANVSSGGGGGSSVVPFSTTSTCDYSTVALNFISRCDDLFDDWDVDALSITGATLNDAYTLIETTGAPYTELNADLFAKGISVSYGDAADFATGGLCEGALACFRYVNPSSPPPPAAPETPPNIIFDPVLVTEDVGVLATILIHEGTHFQQYLDGDAFNSSIDVEEIEFRAFWNMAAFWGDIRGTQGPPFDDTVTEGYMEDIYNEALAGEASLRAYIAARY